MIQKTLFETSTDKSPVCDGAILRDQGMKTAADNAGYIWQLKALEFVRRFPRSEFMAEEVREFAYAAGLSEPPNERAWGAVIATAKRAGLIRFARFASVSNPKAHRTPASVWIKEMEAVAGG